MKKNILGIAGLGALLFFGCENNEKHDTAEFQIGLSDENAVLLSDKVMEAVGGVKRLQDVKLIVFDFLVTENDSVRTKRSHRWDRASNVDFVEWSEGDSMRFRVELETATRSGKAFLNDEALTIPNDVDAAVQRAYAMFINDAYWLLAPFKLQDPGVSLKYQGLKTENDASHEIITLLFDGVGLTPENQYDLYIDPNSNLIKFWDYKPTENAPATRFSWENWVELEGMKFSTEHSFAEGRRKVKIENLHIELR